MNLLLFFGAKFGGIAVVKWIFLALMIEVVISSLVFCLDGEGIIFCLIQAGVYSVVVLVLMLLGAPVAGVIWVLLILQIVSIILNVVDFSSISLVVLQVVYTICNIIGIVLFYKNGLV